MKDKFLPYKLIKDVNYPMHVWFYFHSKVKKMGCQGTNHIGIYRIKYKYVSEKSFWNVERKVSKIHSKE
jgi:hypothetical protein